MKMLSKFFTLTNLIIILSLIVILMLVYLRNNNFELFASETITTTNTTIPILNNEDIQNNALVNFIKKFVINKNQQNVYNSILGLIGSGAYKT